MKFLKWGTILTDEHVFHFTMEQSFCIVKLLFFNSLESLSCMILSRSSLALSIYFINLSLSYC